MESLYTKYRPTTFEQVVGQKHVSAARTDALNTLSAGQGARVTDRGNASEAADRARANAERRFETRHGHGSKPTTDPRRIVTVVIAAMRSALVSRGPAYAGPLCYASDNTQGCG